MSRLAPCPFCGARPKVRSLLLHWVECPACVAYGPLAGSRAWAVRKWNRRVPRKDKVTGTCD